MRAYCKKDHGLIWLVVTKTKFTILDIAAFFTYNKDDTKISIDSDASAADQI